MALFPYFAWKCEVSINVARFCHVQAHFYLFMQFWIDLFFKSMMSTEVLNYEFSIACPGTIFIANGHRLLSNLQFLYFLIYGAWAVCALTCRLSFESESRPAPSGPLPRLITLSIIRPNPGKIMLLLPRTSNFKRPSKITPLR